MEINFIKQKTDRLPSEEGYNNGLDPRMKSCSHSNINRSRGGNPQNLRNQAVNYKNLQGKLPQINLQDYEQS